MLQVMINRCLVNERRVFFSSFSGSRSGQYVYRTCAREDDDDNNGITRTSHCGFVKLDWIDRNRRFRGCLHVCDKDGCNFTSSIYTDQRTTRTILLLVLFTLSAKFVLMK